MSIGRVPGATGIQPSIVDAKGDLIVATAADSVDRLAVGSNNQTLLADSAQSTGVKWGSSPQSLMTATGDLLYASSANTPARLAIGSTSQVLTVSGGVPAWATPSSGFVFLNKTSFSAVASQAVDNVFSSTYDNYLIVVNITQSSLNDIQYCWRTSAPADVTGNYYDNQAGYQSTSTAFDFTAGGATNGTLLRLSGGDGGMVHFVVTDVAAAAMTNINGTANGVKTNNYFGAAISSKHVVQTAYAGIKLSVATGNMSGSITIYGMVKA